MSKSKKIAVNYVIVLIAGLVLYGISCAPDVLWQDSGMIQYRVWHNDIEGKLGLALSHPLFYVLAIGAKYLPIGQFAHKVNLVSAAAAAVAVANLFLLLRLWLGRCFGAVIAAGTFALSHTFWRHASIAETYSLYIALFLAGLIMLLQYVRTRRLVYLYCVGLFNGLAISDHMFASIPFLCYAVFVLVLLARKDIRFKHLVIVVVFWVVGAGLYEYLIVKSLVQSGDFGGTLASAVFGEAYRHDVLNVALSPRLLKENILFILLNFPTPNIVLFFGGCFALYKLSPSRSFANVLLSVLILFLLFAFRYTVVDRYAFFIPFYCMVSIFIGLGAHLLATGTRRRVFSYALAAFMFLPVAVYTLAPAIARKMNINLGTKRELPYRNEYAYFLQPWKTGYRGALRFADEALDSVEDNAVIHADNTTVYPLLYAQQVKGSRRDVKIVSRLSSSENAPVFNEETAADLVSSSAVYVVSNTEGYCPQFLLGNYDFVKAGLLWRAVGKR